MSITYAKESSKVKMPRIRKTAVTQWLKRVAADHDMKMGDVNYLFCDDEYIIEANRQYLGHDYYTDIITFDYTEDGTINGDIILSVDTVRTNAEKFHTDEKQELLRVIAHGVLHLCGINDKGPGEREIMESHEDAALDAAKEFDLFISK